MNKYIKIILFILQATLPMSTGSNMSIVSTGSDFEMDSSPVSIPDISVNINAPSIEFKFFSKYDKYETKYTKTYTKGWSLVDGSQYNLQ